MADYAIHDTTLTGISNVIRKKEGSSALIDPADYADRINLMGMLEEKTVSSSPIVTFSDGADTVPLKKCEITLPASLDGYSEVEVVHAGKNLIEAPTFDAISLCFDFGRDITVDNIVFSFVANGTISSTNTEALIDYRKEDGTHGYRTLAAFYDDNNVRWVNNTAQNGRFSNVSQNMTFRYIYIYYTTSRLGYSAFNADNITNWQVEIGNVASDYEPYTAPTTYTADLGRTIYGGKPDVVNGQGESSYKIVTVGNSGWNYYASGGYIYKDFSDKITPSIGDTDHVLITDNLPYGGVNYASQFQDLHVYQAQNKAIYIKDTSCTSADDFYTKYSDMQIGYELATPEDFTFDPVPIDSKLGNNTLWSEQGDTEVTYRSQGTTTPILPTLVTKTITENGTYSAEDDDADGYSEVTVNVESIAKIGINSGKLNIVNGTITADDTYCYTDPFDCPSGVITMDVGEGIVSDYAGIELIYESDGSHANYWQCASRFREVDLTNYYAATKKARLAFKKQYLSKVLLMDFGNGKIYSSLNASRFEEPQANLLSMNNAQSEESEGSENE